MPPPESFINVIAEAGGDDTPRLVLADWLDEFGTTDQDSARAEIIRLSCTSGYKGGVKQRIGIKEGRWLDANWHRLVPSLKATATEEVGGTGGLRFLSRKGRTITLRWHYARKNHRPDEMHFGCRISFDYWRGFANFAGVSSPKTLLRCGGLIESDEPLAQPFTQDGGWAAQQTDDGTTVALAVYADSLGPFYDLIDGHDTEIAPTTFTRRAKLFDFGEWRETDVIAEVEGRISDAFNRWCRSHVGRSFEPGRGGKSAVEVRYPITYSEWNRENP